MPKHHYICTVFLCNIFHRRYSKLAAIVISMCYEYFMPTYLNKLRTLNFVMNLACYAMGWKLLGRQFIAYSILSSASFSLSYRICEQFPPLWPQLADMPLAASLLGAVFVGVGAGLCVRIGGAPGGDDALAMSLSHVTHIKIQWIYLLSDFAVLGLSLSYIPLNRMSYSILTVLLSGQIIGFVQAAGTHPVENMET